MFFQNKENILKWGEFIIDETTVTIHIIMIIIIKLYRRKFSDLID